MGDDGYANYNIVAIISQYICGPNHRVIHLKLTQCYMSITSQ